MVTTIYFLRFYIIKVSGKMDIRREKIYPEDDLANTEYGDISISKNAGVDEENIESFIDSLIEEGETPFRLVESLCPECAEEEKFSKMKLPAVLYVEDEKVKMKKECSEHGLTESIYWENADMYFEASRHSDWKGVRRENPDIDIDEENVNCPMNCGICSKHKSHTNLGNIAVTNRCPLNCFYCFFFAKEGEPIYEPSQAQIRDMLKQMKQEEPVGTNAVQITGGEPLVRDDITDVVKIAKEEGYDHVQINTEGIDISQDPELTQELVDAGANVFYLSFDGPDPEVNPKNYWEAPDAIQNFREAGAGVVFVPTIINGHNDDQVGDILRFAAQNVDTVRGISYQPVSLVGRMPKSQREKQRITNPGVINKIEEQTDGALKKEDWYPIPSVTQISDLIGQFTGEEEYRLSPHFACGMATYVFIDEENNEIVPITRFLDVDGLFKYIEKLNKKVEGSTFKKLAKTTAGVKLLLKIRKFIDEEKQPEGLNLKKALRKAITARDYRALSEFHHKSLFVGMMHFQDPYNYDVDRVERCVIHYAMPDNRVIPFCAFNVLPELYRDKVQRRFSMEPEEWEERTGKELKNDNYIRDLSEEEKQRIHDYYEEQLSKAPGGQQND